MKHLLSVFVFFASFYLFGQEMGFDEYNQPSSLIVEHPIVKAKYPFIDVHNHQFSMPAQYLSVLVSEMDKLNMAVMVNLSSRGRGSDDHLINSLKNVHENHLNHYLLRTNEN